MKANEYIFFVLIIIVLVIMNIFSGHKAIEARNHMLETDRDLRLYMEFDKACEARMMYLEKVLKDNGITYAP